METFVTTLYPCRRQGFQNLLDKLSLLSEYRLVTNGKLCCDVLNAKIVQNALQCILFNLELLNWAHSYEGPFFNLRWTMEKGKSRGQNDFITKSYAQTWLLFDIIAVKIQALAISVDKVSDPLFEERCRQ
ncbi:hypothetical protein AVEN_228900-1 [Araneus ventricosus]|uniref:Uncharacterized protein n=1 Tax=Araneus ventricosus TaxID=182803 RepID=A0A4Y1ZQZ8_ARAVE|nr:hypothetical protein AVEN_228900-1 [Araneus ventricosus]